MNWESYKNSNFQKSRRYSTYKFYEDSTHWLLESYTLNLQYKNKRELDPVDHIYTQHAVKLDRYLE